MKKTLFITAAVFWILSCRMVNISNDLLETRTGEHHLDRHGTLSFENTNGDLELTEWNNDFIQVETRIYGDSARGVPEGLHIMTEESPDEVAYTVEYPGGMSFVSVDFQVKIPEDSEYLLNTVTVNGETVVIADLDAFIESVNGDILVEAKSSRGLFTVNGDISAVLRDQAECLAVETVNGDITIDLPEEIGLVLETTNGDITVDGIEYDKQVTFSGVTEAAAALETLNGDIEIKLLD